MGQNEALLGYLEEEFEEKPTAKKEEPSKSANPSAPVKEEKKVKKKESNAGTQKLNFNIKVSSEEEDKEKKAIEEQIKKLDEFLIAEEKLAEQNNKITVKEINVSANADETEIDRFLKESKMIWEKTQKEQRQVVDKPKVVKAKQSSAVEKFLAESKEIWAEKQKAAGNIEDKSVKEKAAEPPVMPKKESKTQEEQQPVSEKEIDYELDKGVSVTDLMQWAETYYPEEWLETYKKAQKSKKMNEGAKMIRAGRFRYNQDHQLELLPSIRTDNKSVEELLEIKWI